MNTGKAQACERGQGLVEYALVLVLVGIVVILGLAAFGTQVQKTYCQIIYSVDANADAPLCEALEVRLSVVSTSPFRLEAIVTDNAGDSNITKVVFYVDGAPYNTEFAYHYCLQGGDASCQNYTGHGSHTFKAVAFDADGNVGEAQMTTTAP